MKEIKLTQGKVALVDDEDFDRVNQYKWHYTHGYARGFKKQLHFYLHRFILNYPKQNIDHINRNPLDNRKSNLRLCTHKENQRNQSKSKSRGLSKFKGVSWHPLNKKWAAQITVTNKNVYLGLFENEHQAALVYDLWAIDLFGEFANTNYKPIAHSSFRPPKA